MKEIPILFITPMVRAILDGTKTQTRRVVKDGIPIGNWEITEKHAPYKPGDILWVRETWTGYQTANYVRKLDGRSFTEISDGAYAYKADFETIDDLRDHIRLMSDCSLEAIFIKDDRWFPSTHMPRKVARIFLEVKSVRVERLQDITPQDAEAEGFYCIYEKSIPFQSLIGKSFEATWDSLNAKRGYSWKSNPWVWVIEFERIKRGYSWEESNPWVCYRI